MTAWVTEHLIKNKEDIRHLTRDRAKDMSHDRQPSSS